MIWQIVKKQGLILWRNPLQLLLLIGLPIILIAILGSALSGMMDGEDPKIKVKVAFIEHENEQKQVESFINDLEHSGLPVDAIEPIKSNISQMAPIHILKETVFGSEELQGMVEIVDVDLSEKEAILKDDNFTAVIEVPEQFSYEMLLAMVLKEGLQPELNVYQNEGSPIGSSVALSIIEQYQKQLTLNTFIEKKGFDPNTFTIDQEAIAGEIKTINKKNAVSAKNYYAIGMAVMNVLFIASTVSGIAFLEKKIHVFDRVILANVSRWVYLTAVFISGTIFALLQLLIIFGFSWLVFGVSWPNVGAFFVVTIAIAISVGGISMLLTAISYRVNSEVISNFFSSIIVTLMSFLGGSFFPIGDTSNIFQLLGNLTPNGAGMSAYMAILRGDEFSTYSQHLLFIVLFAAVALVIAVISFPKRGATV